jgi:hypothetical protein
VFGDQQLFDSNDQSRRANGCSDSCEHCVRCVSLHREWKAGRASVWQRSDLSCRSGGARWKRLGCGSGVLFEGIGGFAYCNTIANGATWHRSVSLLNDVRQFMSNQALSAR